MSDHTNYEQRLVSIIKQLDEMDVKDRDEIAWDSHLYDAQSTWIKVLTSGSDFPEAIEEVAARQIRAGNRAKPVGLYFDRSDIIAIQDKDMADRSNDAKRESLIESFQFHAEEWNRRNISRHVVVPAVAKILRKSNLAVDDVDNDLRSHVEKKYRKIAKSRDTGTGTVANG